MFLSFAVGDVREAAEGGAHVFVAASLSTVEFTVPEQANLDV